MDKTCSAAASGCDVLLTTEPAAVAAASAVGLAPCSTLTGTGAAAAAQRQAEGKKNTKKRHSFTALSMTHKSSQATSNRHSMEISAPVLISSSDPRAAARIGDLTHLSSSAPAQVSLGWRWGFVPLVDGMLLPRLFQCDWSMHEAAAQWCCPDVTVLGICHSCPCVNQWASMRSQRIKPNLGHNNLAHLKTKEAILHLFKVMQLMLHHFLL